MPGDTPFDAALAALDYQPVDMRDTGQPVYEILGLDAVRAAHRAEVERAVAEEREAIAAWHDAEADRIRQEIATSLQIMRENASAFVGLNTSMDHEYAQAETHRECAAVIRARGVAKPRTDSEASEQGAKS